MGDKRNKKKGFMYESLFVYESMAHGLVPHSPHEDPDCHDLVVMGDSGNLNIVQVKSVKFKCWQEPKTKTGGFKYNIKATCRNGKISLKDSYVDILVIYTPNEGEWYIIPTCFIESSSISVFAHNPKSKGKYEKFKNAWHLFLGDQVFRSTQKDQLF